jgi:hypothetical protein
MKRYLLFGILVIGVLAIASIGWALNAVRWTLTGSAKPGLSPAVS